MRELFSAAGVWWIQAAGRFAPRASKTITASGYSIPRATHRGVDGQKPLPPRARFETSRIFRAYIHAHRPDSRMAHPISSSTIYDILRTMRRSPSSSGSKSDSKPRIIYGDATRYEKD